MPTLPIDALPLIAFALATIGLIAAKLWALSLDRSDRAEAAQAPIVKSPNAISRSAQS